MRHLCGVAVCSIFPTSFRIRALAMLLFRLDRRELGSDAVAPLCNRLFQAHDQLCRPLLVCCYRLLAPMGKMPIRQGIATAHRMPTALRCRPFRPATAAGLVMWLFFIRRQLPWASFGPCNYVEWMQVYRDLAESFALRF
ncbi:hypothetical protein DM02DRAFT_314443 [Periconia macrospinosa]|uniref:Uncharacterized protein n=1 Tax=Periconia macrospinosa TaxID=97972 RepID=A0A2V1D1C1_9PLEO|nr:hypothetical protein DM02DRAFT_314443 [Periconia macrospinosa]